MSWKSFLIKLGYAAVLILLMFFLNEIMSLNASLKRFVMTWFVMTMIILSAWGLVEAVIKESQ